MQSYEHDRLIRIHREMRSLLEEATRLIQQEGGSSWERARGYWIAQVSTALDNDHDYMGHNMCTMQDTIDELFIEDDEESESEEE